MLPCKVSAMGSPLARLLNQHHCSDEAQRTFVCSNDMELTLRCEGREISGAHNYPTSCLSIFLYSVMFCIQRWTTWGMFFSFFLWGKFIFLGFVLLTRKEQHNCFHLCPGENHTLNVYSLCLWTYMLALTCPDQQFGGSHCWDGVVCPDCCHWEQLSSSWHTLCRCWKPTNLATLLTVAHNPPLCIKGIQSWYTKCYTVCTPWHPTCITQHNPLCYTTLLILSIDWISLHHFLSFLTSYPVKLMTSSPELQTLWSMSCTLHECQVIHTIASQSSLLYTQLKLPSTYRTVHQENFLA